MDMSIPATQAICHLLPLTSYSSPDLFQCHIMTNLLIATRQLNALAMRTARLLLRSHRHHLIGNYRGNFVYVSKHGRKHSTHSLVLMRHGMRSFNQSSRGARAVAGGVTVVWSAADAFVYFSRCRGWRLARQSLTPLSLYVFFFPF